LNLLSRRNYIILNLCYRFQHNLPLSKPTAADFPTIKDGPQSTEAVRKVPRSICAQKVLLDLVNLKTKSSRDGCPKKAIEKTLLRFLDSRTFHTAWTRSGRSAQRMKSRHLQGWNFPEWGVIRDLRGALPGAEHMGLGPLLEGSMSDISEAAKKRRRRAAQKRSRQRAYFVYAHYHHLTALLGTRTLRRARRVVRGLGQRYPLPGLKFWCQPVATSRENVAWPALHEIIVNTLARPENERGSVPAPEPPLPGLNEKEAAQYLGIKLDDLRREINIGRLTCEGPRRSRRFFVAELDRWLTNTRTSRL